MSRLYSKYQPPKLTKLALGGYESFKPTRAEVDTAKNGPSTHAQVDFSAVGKNIVRPIVKNPIVQKVIDPKHDTAMAAAQASTAAVGAIPGPQQVATVPAALATNAFGAVRGGAQMLNNWVDGTYDSSKNPGANTQLATDTTSNLINLIPGGRIVKNLPEVGQPVVDMAAEMIKRPASLAVSTIGSNIAQNQNNQAQTQPTSPTTAPTATPPPVAQSTPQPATQTVKTNSYAPRYNPPKSNYKLAAQEEYLTQADSDPEFTIMQPGDTYSNFIRNNIKSELEIGRRRGALTGTVLGAIAGGYAGNKLLQDYEELGEYSPYAGGALGAVLGAGVGNILGRPVGILSAVPRLPGTVIQSMPIMQDAYRKITQPIFPDSIDPNTYI